MLCLIKLIMINEISFENFLPLINNIVLVAFYKIRLGERLTEILLQKILEILRGLSFPMKDRYYNF